MGIGMSLHISDVTSQARMENFHEGFGNRGLISMTVLLWLREIQQLCVVANLKWFGFQCFNLFLELKSLYNIAVAELSSMRKGIA